MVKGTKGKTIGIISLKGGVGKTTTVANLGAVLAKEFGQNVLLVDANFGAPNLGLHLGIVEPKKTIHHVLSNKADVDEAIHAHKAGFHVMPASFIGRKVNPFLLKKTVGPLKRYYDTILIDSSPNLNEEMLATMVASDELLVVTSPDYPTLSTTLRAVKIAKQKKTPITGLIINKVRGKKFELSLAEIEEAAGVPVLSVLSDSTDVLESVSKATPLSVYKENADMPVELKKLASSLIGQDYEDNRLSKKLKNMFKRGPDKDHMNREILRNERR
jgi:septum site-determining protein MinD